MFTWYKEFLKRRAEEKSRLADRQLNALRFRYHAFKNLLITNNDILEHMTGLDVQLQDRRSLYPGLKGRVDKLLKLTSDLVQNLNYLSEGAYPELFGILRNISARLTAACRKIDPGDTVPLTLPLEEAHLDLIPIVGGKAGPLGALKRELNMPVPEGFVITTEACRLFFERNGLAPVARDLLRDLSPDDFHGIDQVSRRIRERILSARIPQELRDAMEWAYEELMARMDRDAWRGIAVRSSAVSEHGRFSFAGQFATVLNVVSKEGFFRAYKEVIASNFNETSLAYRLHRGMGFQETEMAVLCLAMVPAVAAGTLYTEDPNEVHSERMILCSIWGLGEYLVNGRLPSDIFHVSRLDARRFEPVHLARKERKLVCDRDREGTREETVAEEDALRFSLNEGQIRTLCEYGLAIEKYFGSPQDIEWAIGEDGRVRILQARTLYVRDAGLGAPGRRLERLKLLMEEGTTASKGQASGRVIFVRTEDDIGKVAAGSILVARESFLKIVRVIDRLRGIILERGNPLEHLACVAREHRVPMLVRAFRAMETLQEGQMVTLDADCARVYEGEAKWLAVEWKGPGAGRKEPEASLDPKVEEVRSLIFPLNLLDVRDPHFKMSSCKTVHDIVRFCHEQGIQAMFEVNDGEYAKNKFYVSRLDVPIPFMVDIINLGGGFSVKGHPRKIKLEEITSVPFLAFWKGVSHEGIRWSGPPARVNLKALGSVMSNTMLDAVRSGRALGSRTYVLISRDYMNLNSRLAYHFAMVDTLCSPNAADNYINFRFKGGGTGLHRRILRVRFIARILESLGFFVNIKDDLLNATLKGLPEQEQEERLDMLGRLLGCSRLLDMAMDDERTMEWFVEAFQRGNYSFDADGTDGEPRG